MNFQCIPWISERTVPIEIITECTPPFPLAKGEEGAEKKNGLGARFQKLRGGPYYYEGGGWILRGTGS